jgi:hypothetical protein
MLTCLVQRALKRERMRIEQMHKTRRIQRHRPKAAQKAAQISPNQATLTPTFSG